MRPTRRPKKSRPLLPKRPRGGVWPRPKVIPPKTVYDRKQIHDGRN